MNKRNNFLGEYSLATKKTFTISEMVGKKVFSSDNLTIGNITKIIDQPDSKKDDSSKLCDIQSDLFQVVVKLDNKVFTSLKEPMEILFSSMTLDKIVEDGIKLKLSKDTINAHIKNSLR